MGGRACLNLTVIDDDIAEAEECLVLVVETTKPVAPALGLCCIKDNDGKLLLPITSLSFTCWGPYIGVQVSFERSTYMFLESQGEVEVCVEKLGVTQDTVQVSVTGGNEIACHYYELAMNIATYFVAQMFYTVAKE